MTSPRIAITHGDINGIGYEVIIKTFEDERMTELCTPVLFGSAKILQQYSRQLGLNVQYNVINNISEARQGILNVINCIDPEIKTDPGVSTPVAGQAAFASLEAAVQAIKEGHADILVTAPINKKNIQSENFVFPGHTEYLESVAGDEARALMVLTADTLRVALVTTHLPLAQIPATLTEDLIYQKIKQFDYSLRRDFGINYPRIAVLALNPHAGEEGLLGNEETQVIIPAIEKAKAERIMAFGPYASDGFFGSGRFVKFDGILAMYHDQGLAPFKTMSMDKGVNFSAGLPWVRTSPDHGTGYDISGRGEASPDSLRCAIYEGIDIFRNRIRYDEAHRNPLKKHYREQNHNND